MKKILSILLVVSVMCAVSCKKKEQSTIVSVSDVPESSTSTLPSSVTSEATRETSPSEPETTIEAYCVQDLEYLSFSVEEYEDSFTLEKRPGSMADMPSSSIHFETLHIDDPAFATLQSGIDAVQQPYFEEKLKAYEEECQALKEMNPAFYYEDDGDHYWNQVNINRMDSQIVSVTFCDGCYNFSSKTGEVISLSDVVKDKSAFTKYLDEYIQPLLEDGYIYSEKDAATITKRLHAQIERDTLNFLLNYDGLSVYFGEGTYLLENGYSEVVKISAMVHPEIFNMEFFGHTPSAFSLEFNTSGDLYWDLNADGILEEIRSSNGGFDTISDITVGTFDGDIPNATYYYDLPIYLQSGNSQFLYSYDLSVRLNNDLSLEYLHGDFYPYILPEQWENPICYSRQMYLIFLGNEYVFAEDYTVDSTTGEISYPYAYNDLDENLISVCALTADTYDMDTETVGESIEIPSGSHYDLVRIINGRDYDDYIFRITPPDTHESEYYVQIHRDGSCLNEIYDFQLFGSEEFIPGDEEV